MHRFYADPFTRQGDLVELATEDAHHAAHVLRLHPGQMVELFLDEERFLAELTDVQDAKTVCRLTQSLPTTEAALRITLYQGLPKADKMELIVQKATELGVDTIVPVAMKRCVVQLNGKDGEKKRERWQKIAREASKQSGRCRMLKVEAPISLARMTEQLAAFDGAVVPWEDAHGYSMNAFHAEHHDVRSLAIVIGPEGGMEASEIEKMAEAGCRSITLGPRILRTETAGLAAVSAAMCLWEEMT